jgi:hypothetical protein
MIRFVTTKEFKLILLILSLLGCQKMSSGFRVNSLMNSSSYNEPEAIVPEGGLIPNICSELSFTSVRWPANYSQNDQLAFSLALNISGSYEGHAGWSNLSNNFDGQGLSLGILNQNLGQGSLQPLLIQMRDQHNQVLKSLMTTTMYNSLMTMLTAWEQSTGLGLMKSNVGSMVPFYERKLVNPLESKGQIDKFYGALVLKSAATDASVNWALNNLYIDGGGLNFKLDWEKTLKDLARHPDYVSLQIASASLLHDKAQEYRKRLVWKELRSYLLLFDFIVQNGGLNESHFSQFFNWKKQNPLASERLQLLQMLEIRILDTASQWQNDVRQRKTTIINGTGIVHGESRNLPQEYCYIPATLYSGP